MNNNGKKEYTVGYELDPCALRVVNGVSARVNGPAGAGASVRGRNDVLGPLCVK